MENAHRPCAHMHPAFLPPSSHQVLKSLLESPVPLHQQGFVAPQQKQKNVEDEESSVPQSAFLGPTLWDTQLMDLDELLNQILIPMSPAHFLEGHAHRHENPAYRHESPLASSAALRQSQPSVMVQQATPTVMVQQATPAVMVQQATPAVMVQQATPAVMVQQAPPTVMDLSHTSSCLHQSSSNTGPDRRDTPSPVDPDSIQIPVGFEPDPADVALSSVPGQEAFDPRKRRFSTEELKPQPMIKKARKVYTPEDLKDDRYWARRRKNNMAAKRSRDARRLKENQIAVRAAFLEKENSALRQEVSGLRRELGRTKGLLSRYQAQHAPP